MDQRVEPGLAQAGDPVAERARALVPGVDQRAQRVAVGVALARGVERGDVEALARQAGDQVQQSVWKLRDLQLINATDERMLTQFKTPPPELVDKWSIKSMKFARREPRKS